MRFAIAAASGRTTYTAPPIIMNTATASGPLILSAPRQAAGLALFGEQPLREVHALPQLRDFTTHVPQLRQHVLSQDLQLVLDGGIGARPDALGQGPYQGKGEERDPGHRQHAEQDFVDRHVYLAGGRRSASRCCASNRSKKSTRSASSAICPVVWRSSSTSCRSSLISSVTSSSATGALRPVILAASALPIGEMARRNRVPPPNNSTTATSPTTFSFTRGLRPSGARARPGGPAAARQSRAALAPRSPGAAAPQPHPGAPAPRGRRGRRGRPCGPRGPSRTARAARRSRPSPGRRCSSGFPDR